MLRRKRPEGIFQWKGNWLRCMWTKRPLQLFISGKPTVFCIQQNMTLSEEPPHNPWSSYSSYIIGTETHIITWKVCGLQWITCMLWRNSHLPADEMSESLITPSPQADRHWSGRPQRAWSKLALISMESASHQSLLRTQTPSGRWKTRHRSEKQRQRKACTQVWAQWWP